jgi:hypothetical protein
MLFAVPSLLLVDGLFTAIESQTAAAAIIDRDYNDNLRRLVSNLKKHTSAGDDDEVCRFCACYFVTFCK